MEKQQVKWWEWSIEEIEDNIELFYQPQQFLQNVRNEIHKRTEGS